jgi:hypothetical protein
MDWEQKENEKEEKWKSEKSVPMFQQLLFIWLQNQSWFIDFDWLIDWLIEIVLSSKSNHDEIDEMMWIRHRKYRRCYVIKTTCSFLFVFLVLVLGFSFPNEVLFTISNPGFKWVDWLFLMVVEGHLGLNWTGKRTKNEERRMKSKEQRMNLLFFLLVFENHWAEKKNTNQSKTGWEKGFKERKEEGKEDNVEKKKMREWLKFFLSLMCEMQACPFFDSSEHQLQFHNKEFSALIKEPCKLVRYWRSHILWFCWLLQIKNSYYCYYYHFWGVHNLEFFRLIPTM